MAKEPLAQFLDFMICKFIDNATFATDPSNIVVGETRDTLGLSDSKLPRLELLITKSKNNGYIDQRQVDKSYRFSVGGHLRREQEETTPEDMWEAVRWGTELESSFYSLNDDKIAGKSPCDGFIQVGGFCEVYYEYELFPKITSILMVAEIEVQLTDTYTNN